MSDGSRILFMMVIILHDFLRHGQNYLQFTVEHL
jgi:hypothetical protein